MKPSIELIRLLAVILITFTHTRHQLDEGLLYFVVEKLPTYGTVILSIVSGYLYVSISRHKPNIFYRKIKSLAIPYLIANLSILTIVGLAYYLFDYSALNRLDFDLSLIYEGLFSFNSPPINPPTYFIRDIFLIFCFIALVSQKEWRALLLIVPYIIFGSVLLRYDILIMFILGGIYARYQKEIKTNYLMIISIFCVLLFYVFWVEFLKYPLACLIFIAMIDLKFKFYKTGRFSYLLHLYHSPIIVVTFPLLQNYVTNPILSILSQLLIAIVCCYLLFLLTKKLAFLKILSGGR
jgi:hypothetical protein